MRRHAGIAQPGAAGPEGNSSQSNPARQVKFDRDVPGVSGEIGIGRENLQAVPDCDGADEQVRPGNHRTSNIQHRISNIQLGTLNLEP